MKIKVTLLAIGALIVTTAYGLPQPNTQAPQGAGVKKILIIGDSLAGQTGQAITDQFHSAGFPVDTRIVSHGGSNTVEYSEWLDHPLPWIWNNPRDELQWWLDNFHPDIVLATWGVNRVDSLWGTPWAYLSRWAINNGMNDVKNRVQNAGAKLYWTLPPRIDVPDFNLFLLAEGSYLDINTLGVATVDWRAATSDSNGNYQRYLRYTEDNQDREIRWADGIHFTGDGVNRAAKWTISAMAPDAG